jgi:uncharacterized protein YkwD
MLRRWVRVLLLLTLLVALSAPFVPSAAQSTTTSSQPTAFDMLAAMNAWRLREGLWPFKPNPTLQALAWLQARYLLSKPNLPPEEYIHDGITGDKPRQRAEWDPYDWPYYYIPQRVSLEEITVAQHTVEAGITWWDNSPIHHHAALNPNYREIGVAALPYQYGTVFVAVLGGRPNVLPVMIHPDGTTLYLTQETYAGASGGDYMTTVDDVRLLDSDGTTVLADWQPWQATLPMPEVSGDTLIVESRDSQRTIQTVVNVQTDIFPLPDYVDQLRPATGGGANVLAALQTVTNQSQAAGVTVVRSSPDALLLQVQADRVMYLSDFQFFALEADTPPPVIKLSGMFPNDRFASPGACYAYVLTGSELPVSDACTGTLIVRSVAPERVFWYDSTRDQPVGLFVLDERGNMLADCRDPAGSCAFRVAATTPPVSGGPGAPQPITRRLRLLYNSNSFSLLNISGQTLDISGMTLTDGTHSMNVSVWSTPNDTASIYTLPTGDCFQVWLFGDKQRSKPSACKVRHAWVTIPASRQFWTGDSFQVMVDGQEVTTCDGAGSASECVFELP